MFCFHAYGQIFKKKFKHVFIKKKLHLSHVLKKNKKIDILTSL
jgi:hypothetical protein